ncbi:two-component response regulator ORR23 [Artemisia annua]|uniref:Two-component response regulator ORR23 n=1 Tax=Artemisia annua TaxID=35608 RepID=A0A2U1LUI8_ARTAN|nr:two-component response regulator ORR23 [Artemisia annua]
MMMSGGDYDSDQEQAVKTHTSKNADKGKEPLDHKRKNDQQVEDEKDFKKRRTIKSRMEWSDALERKFMDALDALGENAYPRAILKYMNVPRLTRRNVASHHQKFKMRKKTVKKANIVAPPLTNIKKLKLENYVCKRCGFTSLSDNDASIIPGSSSEKPLNLNSTGISFMTLENIKAKLPEAPSLHLPQVTAIINNSGGGQEIDNSFGDLCQPLMGETSMMSSAIVLDENPHSGKDQSNQIQMTDYGYGNAMEPLITHDNYSHHAVGEAMPPLDVSTNVASDYNLGTDDNNFFADFINADTRVAGGSDVNEVQPLLDDFGIATESCIAPLDNGDTGASGGSIVNEVQAPLDCFETDIQTWIAGDDDTDSLLDGLDDMVLPDELPSYGLGDPFNSLDFEDFLHSTTISDHGNVINPAFSNIDADPLGLANGDSSLPDFLSDENISQEQIQQSLNSSVPLDSSQGTVIDNDSFMNLIQSDHKTAFQNINDSDFQTMQHGP